MRFHAAVALVVSGCMFLPEPAAPLPERILWRFDTVANYISHRAAVADDGTVYVNDSSGFLYALDENGTLLWDYDGGGIGSTGPTVVGTDGTIYFGTGSGTPAIHALNPDGTLKWMFEDPDSQGPIGGPSIGPDGNVYAVFDVPGDFGVVSLSPAGVLLWNNLGDPVVADFAESGREIVFTDDELYWTSSYPGAFYAFEIADGDQVFQLDLADPGQACTGKHAKQDAWVVYVATGVAPRLNAYDKDGNLKWQHFGNEGTVTNTLSAPHCIGGAVFINRNLFELEANESSGKDMWDTPSLLEQGTSGPIVNPPKDLIVLGGQSDFGRPGVVQGFDPRTGNKEWAFEIPKEPNGSCAVPYGRAMFTPDGDRAYIPAVTLCTSPNPLPSYLYAIDTAP
jgi:outer membrane protein assembly factor BamB